MSSIPYDNCHIRGDFRLLISHDTGHECTMGSPDIHKRVYEIMPKISLSFSREAASGCMKTKAMKKWLFTLPQRDNFHYN